MASERLTLELDGDLGIDADGFVAFFKNAIEALREIDKEESAFGVETLRWRIVDAGFNSPFHATLESSPLISGRPTSEGVADAFLHGLEHLNTSNTCPRRLNLRSLHAIRLMVSAAYVHKLTPVVSAKNERVRVVEQAAENASFAFRSESARKPHYFETGSIEGVLMQLASSASMKRNRLVIVDRVTANKVQCFPLKSVTESELRAAWKRRVIAFGKIRVDAKTLRPNRIDVQRLEVLPGRDDSLKPADLPRLDITGGIDSCEYVRSLRDDG